ncbi:hypothetical protein NDU88_000919, partial [Pleurodeles waltl]
LGRETTHLSTLNEEPGHHGARATGPAHAGLPPHLPGIRKAEATTTVSTALSTQGWWGRKKRVTHTRNTQHPHPHPQHHTHKHMHQHYIYT